MTDAAEETTATADNATSTLMANAATLSTPGMQDHQHCLVCYSELEYAGMTPCGHNDVCGICHLRLRHLHSDKKCIMCKQMNELIVVDTDHLHKQYSDYPIWGDTELGADFIHRSDVGMFFPTSYYEREILPLFGFYCTEPNCDYDGTTPDPNIYEQQQQQSNKKSNKKPPTPLRALQDHLRNKHRSTLCQLCVDFRRDFVSLLPRFSPNQLKRHMNKGDGSESGFKGHPLCEFCRPKRFYDLTQLYTHLQKDHYKCHVCEKQGLPNQYFRDYNALERHFDRQHFLCPDPQCLAARFVVFENEIDFRAHERNIHGSSGGSTKIQLEFRVRRPGQDEQELQQQDVPTDQDFQFGLDGQAFVPEPLPASRGPDEQSAHPLHLQRTAELRAHAAQIRQEREMESAPEAFPTLNEQRSGSSGNLRAGWTGEGGATVLQRVAGNAGMARTQENFPSLPSASGNKKKVKGGPVSGGRSFAAMRSAAMGIAPSNAAASSDMWGGAATAASGAPSAPSPSFLTSSSAVARNRESDLTPDNFPSLGGTSTARYPAAERVARKTQSSNAPPALTSAADFPPPPSASSKQSVREKILTEPKAKAPTQAALDNVMHFPPPTASSSSVAHGKATVEEMKASMGSAKYKQLKNLTKEFASDALSPEAYVDHAAALFDSGYGDRDFWTFLPSLLASCPNVSSAQRATRYMEKLRQSQYDDSKLKASEASRVSQSGWSAPPAVTASAASASSAAASAGWASVSAANRPRLSGIATHAAPYRPMANSGGKKAGSAWVGASGGASTVMRAKSRPASVSVAAAQEGPQTGTATKFMAKQSKQKQEQASTKSTSKKIKKKQNAELRALAFGR